jgi:hypothetical protein
MALRLGPHVIRGELNNTKRFSTFGRFEIVGRETPIVVELTGDCGPDLKGKRVYFEAAPAPTEAPERPNEIAGHLIGVTGTIAADSWVRVFDCSPEEFYRRAKLGEAPPTRWARRFYFEFYSQHGRTLIELGGPTLLVHGGGGEEDWSPLPDPPPPTEPADPDEETRRKRAAESPGPEITIVRSTGETERVDPREVLDRMDAEEGEGDLQRSLDAEAARVDRAIREPLSEDEDESAREMASLELMDRLIDRGEGDPLILAFKSPQRLPAPDDVPEEKVEPLLKGLLAELALFGVALHVCEHYTPREAYRLLVENIATEWKFRPELVGTGWVQNFMTGEYCKQCEEEAIRDYGGSFESEGDEEE